MENSESLNDKKDIIQKSIQSSLNKIAMTLLSNELLSSDEYDAVTDPENSQSNKLVGEIFRSIVRVVREDNKNYQLFRKVVKEMGPPISRLVL